MQNHQLFINDLQLNLEGDILADDLNLGLYSTDASVYQIKPIVVVLPKNEADVVTAVKIAADHKISILPRGAGTSLAGQTVGHSMVLDFSKYLNQIVKNNVTEKWVRVQPGMARDDLNVVLKQHGLIFAPDPATSSRANVGGMIGNNSSGTKSILYGKTVDHVLELKTVLSNGEVCTFGELDTTAFTQKTLLENREGNI